MLGKIYFNGSHLMIIHGMQMMRVPFDRKPRPDGTKPRKEKTSARCWRIGRLQSPKLNKKQPQMEGSFMGMSQVADNPFDERQGDFMAFHQDEAGPTCRADTQEDDFAEMII